MNVRHRASELIGAKRKRLGTVQRLCVAELLQEGKDPRIVAACFGVGVATVNKISTEGALRPRDRAAS